MLDPLEQPRVGVSRARGLVEVNNTSSRNNTKGTPVELYNKANAAAASAYSSCSYHVAVAISCSYHGCGDSADAIDINNQKTSHITCVMPEVARICHKHE